MWATGSAPTPGRKFVINGLPEDSDFPVKFTDFQVVHHYLHSAQKEYQTRTPTSPSSSPTSRWSTITCTLPKRNTKRGLRLPRQVHRLPGGPPLPALCPKGIPDEAEEEGEERQGHLHLHR